MAEPLARTEPVPSTAFVAPGFALRLAPPMARYSLRARSVSDITALAGVEAPAAIGNVVGGLICLGPDEWLLRAATKMPLLPDASTTVAVTDISERAICLIAEGELAARILAAGCPLDLDQFSVGRATRTLFETVEIILIREAEDRFHVEVWRSFAPWLWTALTTAASH